MHENSPIYPMGSITCDQFINYRVYYQNMMTSRRLRVSYCVNEENEGFIYHVIRILALNILVMAATGMSLSWLFCIILGLIMEKIVFCDIFLMLGSSRAPS